MYHYIVPVTTINYYTDTPQYRMGGPAFKWETIPDLVKRLNVLESMQNMKVEFDNSLHRKIKDLEAYMIYWELRIRYSDDMMSLHHFKTESDLSDDEIDTFISNRLHHEQLEESLVQTGVRLKG